MLPPGPRTPVLWQTFRFLTQPKAYSRKLSAIYGDAIRFQTLMGKGVAFGSPELAREVFSADPEMFEQVSQIGRLFGPQAVIATAGSVHKRQRKLLNPQFHGARVKAFLRAMQGVVRQHLEALGTAAQNGDVVVMSKLTQALTLDIIVETIFGSTKDLDRVRTRRVLNALMDSITPLLVASPTLHHRLFPPFRNFVRCRAELDTFADDVIASRRARGDLGADILGTLLEARYDDETTMGDTEIRDQLVTLLLAGHETTAIAVAWGIHWLLREP